MSVIVQARRTASATGTWDEQRETLGDRVVATLDALAPGLAGSSSPGRSSRRSTSSAISG